MDHLNEMANNNGVAVGVPVILPSSFKDMREKYHDAMTIVAQHGRRYQFITMICNPN
jgi:hypothetical protein